MLSVYRDMSVEPQWRPDWIDLRFLMADAFGRVYAAFAALPSEIAPQSWKQRIEAAKKWVEDDHLDLIMRFPAVLEGAPRGKIELPLELTTALKDASDLVLGEPSIDNLLRITSLVEAVGVPDGIGAALLRIIEQIRSGANIIDPDVLHAALTMLAHIATLTKDASLADAISEA